MPYWNPYATPSNLRAPVRGLNDGISVRTSAGSAGWLLTLGLVGAGSGIAGALAASKGRRGRGALIGAVGGCAAAVLVLALGLCAPSLSAGVSVSPGEGPVEVPIPDIGPGSTIPI